MRDEGRAARDERGSANVQPIPQRLFEPSKHAADVVKALRNSVDFGGFNEVELSRKYELCFDFGKRPAGDPDEPNELSSPAPRMPFRDVARHRNRGPSDLLRHCEQFGLRERSADRVDIEGETDRRLPHLQIVVALDRHGSQLTVNGRRPATRRSS